MTLRHFRLLRDGVLAALTFVVVVELCIHVDEWIRWDATPLAPYSDEGLRFADELGFRNRPGAAFQKWVINEHGFRGPSVELTKAPETTRVAVLGASEAFGLFESVGKEFPAQLQEVLSGARTNRVEVVNAAVAGSSLEGQRELYENWVSRFEPDFVVIYPTPSFYLSDEIVPEADHSAELEDSGSLSATLASPQFAGPRWELRLPARLGERVRGLVPARLAAWKNRWSIGRSVRAHEDGWRWTTVPEDRVERFASDLEDLAYLAAESGAEVVLATHANKYGPASPYATDPAFIGWWRFFARADSAVLIQTVVEANERVRNIGQEMELTVVDLERVLGGRPELFADANHFTDLGAARAAEAIAEAIQATETQRSPGHVVESAPGS